MIKGRDLVNPGLELHCSVILKGYHRLLGSCACSVLRTEQYGPPCGYPIAYKPIYIVCDWLTC